LQEHFAEKMPAGRSLSPSRADFSIAPNAIVVQFVPGFFFSSTSTPEEISETQTPSIDDLIAAYRVERIWKQFRRSIPPQAPTEPDLSRLYRVRFPADFDPNEVAAAFAHDPNVESAQVIGIHPVHQTPPSDTYFAYQWALENTGQLYWPEYELSGEAGSDVGAIGAWQLRDAETQVLIAVVDTGVDWKHPDLEGTSADYADGNIYFNEAEVYGVPGADDDRNGYVDDYSGWDWVEGVLAADGEDWVGEDNDPMDFNGHGTHCAGIIGAIADNGIGIAGLAPDCKIIPLRAAWEAPDGGAYVRMDFCAEAIVYATDLGAAVILCGWGSSDSGAITEAVDYAISKGVLVVVSAGNDSADTPHYLASREDCIAVAATDAHDLKAPFSNYGLWVDVSAPGADVISTSYARDLPEPDCHTYAYDSGTSIAAAHVAALMGLIKSCQPDLSAEQITDIVLNSADDIDSMNPGLEGKLGAGRIDAETALALPPPPAETELGSDRLADALPVTQEGAPTAIIAQPQGAAPAQPREAEVPGIRVQSGTSIPGDGLTLPIRVKEQPPAEAGLDRARRPPYVQDEIIVKFKPGAPEQAIQELLNQQRVFEKYESKFAKFKVLKIPKGKAVLQVVEAFKASPLVEYAEPNYYAYATMVPNDPRYSLQWHLDNLDYGGIHMEQAWDKTTGSASIVVAVLDTGIAYEGHPAPAHWHIDTYQAYSGHSWWCGLSSAPPGWWEPDSTPPGYGNGWKDYLQHQFDLTGATGKVTFSYYYKYDIERNFDYFYVDVSDDGGLTWTVLKQYTNKPGAPPGGKPVDWTQDSLDLSDYKGKNILIRFRFNSDDIYSDEDGNFNSDGAVYIDEITLEDGSGTLFYDDVESAPGEWETTRYEQAPDLAGTNFWVNSDEIADNGVDDHNNGYVDDINGWDFINSDAHPNDDEGHGTHVSGTIAQTTNNNLGVAGIAFSTTIMPVKVLNAAGTGTYDIVAQGVYYAANNGAKVINMSLGGTEPSTALENAVAYAHKNGVTVIAASGNANTSPCDYPARYDSYVIAVGATQYDESRAPYSNYGSSLDLVAPGGNTGVNQNGDGYADGVLQNTFGDTPVDWSYWFYQGTSMSTPHVAGVAALLLAQYSTLSPDDIRQALQSTAEDLGDPGWDQYYGWGLIDAQAALTSVTPTITVASSTGQPVFVDIPSTDNIMGSVSIVRNIGTGQVSAVALKENGGTIDAANELANIEVWLSSDWTWDAGDEQLDTAKTFDGEDGECTFNESFDVTTTPQYLIVRADVVSGATVGDTIEIQVMSIATTDTVSGTPCNISGTTSVTPLWWNPSWPYRQRLTFDNSAQAENLIAFPVLVKLTSANFNFALAQPQGQDIRFIDSDNFTMLSYEIELWDSVAEEAIIWVKVPQIDANSDTDFIYMYYGNPSATDAQNPSYVWSNGYVAVYHFAEQIVDYQDSTANANHANIQQVTSQNNTDPNGVGYYPYFDGIDDYVGVLDDDTLDFGSGDFTVEVRARSSTTKVDTDLIRKGSTNTANSWWKLEWGDAVTDNCVHWQVRVSGTNADIYYNTLSPDDNWHNIAATRNSGSNQIELFVDSLSVVSGEGIAGDVSNSASMGIGSKDTYTDDFFDGNLDEVRLSNVLRSADWIAAQHLSMNHEFITTFPVPPLITVASSTSQPGSVATPSTDNVMGSVSIVRNTGTAAVTSVTLKENGGSIDAQNELENVELWLSSDDNWDVADTLLDTAKNFDANEECTFTQNFNVTTTPQYLIVRLDVKTGVPAGKTVEIQVQDIATTDRKSGLPCDIMGTTTVGAEIYPVWGVLHSIHTTISDGSESQQERVSNLNSYYDWASTVDHDTQISDAEWTATINEASNNNIDNSFTYFPGYEWKGTAVNNAEITAFFMDDGPATKVDGDDTSYDDFGEFLAWLAANNGMGCANHPARSANTYDWTDPDVNNETYLPCVEMVNKDYYHWNDFWIYAEGSGGTTYPNPHPDSSNWTGGVKAALDNGLHLGFVAGWDYHGSYPGTPTAYTGLVNPASWTRAEVFAQIRKRHTWAAEEKILMALTYYDGLETKVMGDLFTVDSAQISLDYDIEADSGQIIEKVNLFYDGIIVSVANFSLQSAVGSFEITFSDNAEHYIFVEAVQDNDKRAWSSPMYITYPADIPTISSAASQTFEVNDPPTAISTITTTDAPTTPAITAANDIRMKIPSTFNMTWDETDTDATIEGEAQSKVSTTVSYEDSSKTLVIDVTTDFSAGDSITVSDLSFKNFTAVSAADNLELVTGGAGASTVAYDDKTITIIVVPHGWTAYNDCGDAGNSSWASTGNVTNYGAQDSSGNLVTYSSDEDTGVTISYSGGGITEGYGAEDTNGANRTPPVYAPSGDAATEFAEILNLAGISYAPKGNTITVTLSGVSNTKEYTLVALGMRGNSTYNRWCSYTISNVQAFVNSSSIGTEISTTSMADDTTTYKAGDNYDEGYLAKWTDIVPTGSTITLTVSGVDHIDPPATADKAYLSAIKLVEELPEELSVWVSPDYWHMGTVQSGSVNTMIAGDKLTVQNDGTITETFTLEVTDTGAIWFAATTEDGNTDDTFVMSGLFTSVDDTIGAVDFNEGTDDDVIRPDYSKAATAVLFGCANSTAGGFAVPATESRSLWLQFKAPTSTTTFQQQSTVIMVGAQAPP